MSIIQLEISQSSGKTLTLVLIVLMPQIACKDTRTSYIGHNYDTLIYHNYTMYYPKRQQCDTFAYHNYATNHQ